MIISLDYDDTYTRDKVLWDGFIKQARSRGHVVYCVTARDALYDSREVLEDLQDTTDGIYFTSGRPKEKYMSNLGISVSIWIDDSPQAIVPRVVVDSWGERVIPVDNLF